MIEYQMQIRGGVERFWPVDKDQANAWWRIAARRTFSAQDIKDLQYLGVEMTRVEDLPEKLGSKGDRL